MSNQKPVIEFNGYRITNVDFKVFDDFHEIEELSIENGQITTSLGLNDDYSYGQLKLRISLIDEDKLRVILVEVTGQFKINETDREKVPDYLQINGSAILMPYLRSFVSILTSLDNPDSVILPTINTHNFSEFKEGINDDKQ